MLRLISLRVFLVEEDGNHETLNRERAVRRSLRDFSNPLGLPDKTFNQHYRVNKELFKYLLDTLNESLEPSSKSFSIPNTVKLASCLRFFAEGGYQKGVARDKEVSLAQPTFSKVLTQVLNIFERKLCPLWIKWPSLDEQKNAAEKFFRKHLIPGIFGCVDGTHISIIPPKQNQHLYYNRKGFYSLNAMIVCDFDGQILYVDATHPGSSHDAMVWSTSECQSHLENNYSNGNRNLWLLGDAGYPLEPWLITPHRTPAPASKDLKFNTAHTQARNVIERVNGILKNRWRCLLGARQLHYSPHKAVKIVNVCVALHNLCLKFKSTFECEQNSIEVDDCQPTPEVSIDVGNNFLTAATQIRANITNNM